MSVLTEQQEVLEELRSADRLFLTTHENPDGDALGSLRAMQIVLEALGKDSVMFMARDEFPLPREYRHMPFDDVLAEPPPDMDGRLVVFLDCGNMDRMPVDFIKDSGARIVNIDHHHDNTRFGDVNLVKGDASCTAEIVYTIARELGVDITQPLAEAPWQEPGGVRSVRRVLMHVIAETAQHAGHADILRETLDGQKST